MPVGYYQTSRLSAAIKHLLGREIESSWRVKPHARDATNLLSLSNLIQPPPAQPLSQAL
jgi:hypothetical protein